MGVLVAGATVGVDGPTVGGTADGVGVDGPAVGGTADGEGFGGPAIGGTADGEGLGGAGDGDSGTGVTVEVADGGGVVAVAVSVGGSVVGVAVVVTAGSGEWVGGMDVGESVGVRAGATTENEADAASFPSLAAMVRDPGSPPVGPTIAQAKSPWSPVWHDDGVVETAAPSTVIVIALRFLKPVPRTSIGAPDGPLVGATVMPAAAVEATRPAKTARAQATARPVRARPAPHRRLRVIAALPPRRPPTAPPPSYPRVSPGALRFAAEG